MLLLIENRSKGSVPQSASQQSAVPPLVSECPLSPPETRHGKPEHQQHERRLSPRDGDAASERDEAALPVHHERAPRGADDLAQSASQRRPLDCRASYHAEGVPPSEGHGEGQDPRQHGHNPSCQDGRRQGAAQDLRGDLGEHRGEGHGWRDEARDLHEGHGLSGREDCPELRPPQGQDVPPGARVGQPVPALGKRSHSPDHNLVKFARWAEKLLNGETDMSDSDDKEWSPVDIPTGTSAKLVNKAIVTSADKCPGTTASSAAAGSLSPEPAMTATEERLLNENLALKAQLDELTKMVKEHAVSLKEKDEEKRHKTK